MAAATSVCVHGVFQGLSNLVLTLVLSTGTFAFILAAHLLFRFFFLFVTRLPPACLSVNYLTRVFAFVWRTCASVPGCFCGVFFFFASSTSPCGGGRFAARPAVCSARPHRPARHPPLLPLLPLLLSPISLPNPTLPSGALVRSAGSVQFCRSAPH